MVTGAAWIADALRGLFVWAIIALAFWRAFRPSMDQAKWRNSLGKCVLVGALGCMLASLAFAGSMVEQHLAAEGGDWDALTDRWFGPYAWSYWAGPLSLLLAAIVLFLKRSRRSWWIAWAMALLLTNHFSLFERLVIVITSLHRDYLPSSWTRYHVWIDLLAPILLLLSALLMWSMQHRISAQRRA